MSSDSVLVIDDPVRDQPDSAETIRAKVRWYRRIRRRDSSWIRRLRIWLLHIGNQGTPSERFYALKDVLCKRYGVLRCYLTQEILKTCYACDGLASPWWDPESRCDRCRNGVYSRRWWLLEEWDLDGYIFHRPSKELFIEPDRVDIHGRIEHAGWSREYTYEARLWLYLVCGDLGSFLREISTSQRSSPGLWPLLRLQRIVFGVRIGRFKWCAVKARVRLWWWMLRARTRGLWDPITEEDDDIPF